ncbi:S9 family peptidase [bacterium]|nr:S9 family peptidase [candidate division CSSED10-310 bacterium]
MSRSNPIPLETIFGNPTRINPQISPDGTRLAYVAPLDGVLNVWIRNLETGEDQPLTRDTDRGVVFYFWAFTNRHIIHIQDSGGNENYHIFRTDLETGETVDLTPFENIQALPVEMHRDFPDQMLFAMNRDRPEAQDVYRMNILDGSFEIVARNPGNFMAYTADADFKLRVAKASNPDASADLLFRETEESPWKSLIHWEPDDVLQSFVYAFTKDGEFLFMIDSRDVNAARLLKYEIKTGQFEIIAQDDTFDVRGVMIHPETHELQAYRIYKARQEWTVLDDAIRDDFEFLRSIEDGDLFLTSRSRDDTIWIAGFEKDDGPDTFYLFDRKQRQAEYLFCNRPELEQYRLATMEPISFQARDGLTIHGYISFPPDSDRKDLPMVLNVHGGPWYRDTWGFNPEVAWLTDRGYICLQVNFRGSTGYGKDFVNAADREWGGRMHTDLVDAVAWAVDRGYADPERIAIYGASYGGYAALVGATVTPDLFRCAVDIVGPSNLITFLHNVPPYWSMMLPTIHRQIGHPEQDREFLESRSPLFHVDNIRIPMLIAQGANDPRVKKIESEQIVEAMKEKGIYTEYLLFPDEGHGFAKPQNRLKFYAAAEKFLSKHLGGRCEI